MAQNANMNCLHSLVTNTSGKTRTFGYCSPHSARLEPNESRMEPGDIRQTLANMRSRRKFRGLERSLDRGSLTIVSTPPPILYDAVRDVSKMLAMEDGDLGYVDPCWDSSGSSTFSAPL